MVTHSECAAFCMFIYAPHSQRVVRKDSHTVESFILYGQNETPSFSSLFRSFHAFFISLRACAFVFRLFKSYEKRLEKHEFSRWLGDCLGCVVVRLKTERIFFFRFILKLQWTNSSWFTLRGFIDNTEMVFTCRYFTKVTEMSGRCHYKSWKHNYENISHISYFSLISPVFQCV